MSTEQDSGVAVSLPLAVNVIRELAGSRRYCSLNGFCNDLISTHYPPKLICPTFLHLDSEFLAVRARRNPGMPLKQRTEERHVLVADGVADLLHRSMIALQQTLRGSDP